MAQQEIKLNEKQKAIINQASSEVNRMREQMNFAQQLLTMSTNKANELVKLICLNNDIDAPEGTRFDGEKIIIPEAQTSNKKPVTSN